MYTPHVVDPFIRQRLLGSFLPFGFCELCCCENGCPHICPQSVQLLSIILFIPRRGNVDFYGNSGITRENRFLIFFKNSHTVFSEAATILHSQKQCPLSPHSCKGFLFSIFWILAILRGLKWNNTMGRQVPLLLALK